MNKQTLTCLKIKLPTRYSLTNQIHSHTYKQDVAFDNPQGCICHKPATIQPTLYHYSLIIARAMIEVVVTVVWISRERGLSPIKHGSFEREAFFLIIVMETAYLFLLLRSMNISQQWIYIFVLSSFFFFFFCFILLEKIEFFRFYHFSFAESKQWISNSRWIFF